MVPTEFTVAVTDAQLKKQLGNAMSVNDMERLLVRVLPAAGLVQHGVLVDRWESGEAIKRLTGTIGMGFKGTDNVSHGSDTTEDVSNTCKSEIVVGFSRGSGTASSDGVGDDQLPKYTYAYIGAIRQKK